MNQLISLLLLAAPSANAMAAYMAAVPMSIRTMVDADQCILPENFSLRNFIAESDDDGETLDTIEFGYANTDTAIETTCQLNSTSEPIRFGSRTPRYPCNDPRVVFIYTPETTKVTMIEEVCPDENGESSFEASAGAIIEFTCDAEGACASDEEYTSRFSSFNPVPNLPPGNSTANDNDV